MPHSYGFVKACYCMPRETNVKGQGQDVCFVQAT